MKKEKLKYINTHFIKPVKNCNECNINLNHTCYDHERLQVKSKYKNAELTHSYNWVILD